MTTAFCPRECREGESRVAVTPETAKRLSGKGLDVRVERGAGLLAGFTDEDYAEAGATLVGEEAWGEAGLLLKVQPPTAEELGRVPSGTVLVSFVQAARHPDIVRGFLSGGVTSLAMELVPRITRAQSMDALSSQATVAGYKAALLGAAHLKPSSARS